MRTQETTRQTARPSTSKIWRFNGVAAAVAVALGGLAAVPGQAFAAAPAANSTIGNTASATYTDASLVNRTATSNTVNTIVQQVSGFTLVADRTAVVAPGGQVVYSHTLTNTGNGSEDFVLTSGQTTNGAGDQIDLTGFKIYADADGNGVADNATDLTGSTVTLASNGVFKFVVVGSAPGTAVAGNTAVTTVTATTAVSAFNPVADTSTNTDTATVTADAVITVTKSASVITGPIGTEVQYTLTYTNTGNNTATGVVITDAIPRELGALLSGMKYKANSGIWSSGGTLTDTNGANDDGGAGIDFSVSGSHTTDDETVHITIASVAPNVSGTIKFTVRVDDQATGVDTNPVAAPGILTNTATFLYNNGTAPVGSQPTNSVDFTVTQTSAVAANDSNTISAIGGVDDEVTVATAGQGTVVVFDNYIWNNGNGTDTFNITYANGGGAYAAFPAGTSFQLFQADGVNVLQDTNSDGVPDTGALAPGASYKVVLKATLPSDQTGGAYAVTKRATSVINPLVTDTVLDVLTLITPNVVDLANSAANDVLGAGNATGKGTVAGGAGFNGAWTTKAINPGATATFPLFITNKVGQADNYNLSADNDTNPLNAVVLPAGWTFEFRNDGGAGDCSTTGATITNTGTVNTFALPADQRLVCAVVSVPATQIPVASQNIYFRVVSPVTGVEDTKLDAVTVNTFRNIQMTSDNTGQVFPGGSVVYTHLVTNNGNVVEGSASGEITFTGANTLSASGFSTVFYIDTNNDGTLDAGDQAITATNFQTLTTAGAVGNGIAGLSPAETVRIFAKVQAPASATPGTTDAATITAVVTGTINTIVAPTSPVNTDTTNVIGGQIRLDKTQALDANCDGDFGDAAAGAFRADSAGYVTSNLSALPGECIMYRIVATNEGVSAVTGITINDATPAFTKLSVAPAPAITTANTTLPAPATTGISTNLQTGALGATVSELNGGQTATFTFSVKIDQ
ncbi:hypothetical protein FK216_06240 [Moraxellaceae bacterium AER2_44_116]|nr:hypothetical protein [Moraxellaceae bacterium]TQC98455.1 hypothetical protein FK216_06240 [Moraxellaceae bacterium AER2_44_116]